MTDQKEKDTKSSEVPKSKVQTEFEALPLDKKIASLLQMEAVTISEAFSYVIDSSAKAFEKAGIAIEQFGAKFEKEVTKAATSSEPKPDEKSSTAKPKSRPAKKAPNAGAAK